MLALSKSARSKLPTITTEGRGGRVACFQAWIAFFRGARRGLWGLLSSHKSAVRMYKSTHFKLYKALPAARIYAYCYVEVSSLAHSPMV